MELHQIFAVVLLSLISSVDGGDSYSVFRDTYCPGNDFLGGFRLDDKFACMDVCDSYSECNAFAYKDTQTELSCWLKSTCTLDDLVQNDDGWIMFLKMTDDVDNEEDDDEEDVEEDQNYIEAGACQFSMDPNHALHGKNDRRLSGMTSQECLNACAADEDCKSVEHHPKKQRCTISFSSRTTHPQKYGSHKRVNYYQKEKCDVLVEDTNEIIRGICIKTMGPVGSDDGQPFSEEDLFFQSHGNISKIEVRHYFFVNCISFTYGRNGNQETGPCHGGSDGTVDVVELAENEYITGMHGSAGSLIDKMHIVTNVNTYGPFGSDGGTDFSLSGDNRLAFVSGRNTSRVSQLSLHFYC